jgi:hypothetical protein
MFYNIDTGSVFIRKLALKLSRKSSTLKPKLRYDTLCDKAPLLYYLDPRDHGPYSQNFIFFRTTELSKIECYITLAYWDH